jgi:hypothetical protein
LAMIPVTLLPLPAAILTSNGLPNRIFPAEAVEPLATRTACPGWGLCLRERSLVDARQHLVGDFARLPDSLGG